MKIGLLFGSFNPIHIGHIAIATSVLNSHVVDKVFFVVAMQNPWKTQKAIDFNIRCSMVHNAIKDVENLQLSTVEMNVSQPTYTYKVIKKLKDDYPNDELFLIGGEDVINNVESWANFQNGILPYVGFIAVGDNIDGIKEAIGKTHIIKVNMPHITIRSTLIREMAREGKILYPLVTKETEESIYNHQLYKD